MCVFNLGVMLAFYVDVLFLVGLVGRWSVVIRVFLGVSRGGGMVNLLLCFYVFE